MCLYKTHFLPKIAWKPIKCYKIVFPKPDSCFRTPCLCYEGTLNKPIKHRVSQLGIFKRLLYGEVVHAFRNKSSARSHYCRIVECIIPRFTLYWLGEDNEIGARTIIPLRYI